MSLKNKERARLALAELEKEMEILTNEEMNACKGGEMLSGYVGGIVQIGSGIIVGGVVMPAPSGGSTGNGWLGGTGTENDPYRLSEVVVTGGGGGSSNRYSSNFGGSLYYTGGGYSSHQRSVYGPVPAMGGSGGGSSDSSWNALVNGVSAFTFTNGVKTELIGWASTMDEITTVSSKYLKFTKGLGVAGATIQVVSSSINIAKDYSSGGISNVNGWDMADAGVAATSIVATIFLGSNPVGWVIAGASGGYYLYRVLSEE